MNYTQGTEPYNAQATKTIERQGSFTVPYTRRLPEIRGGLCEFCGVIDPNFPSQFQYQLCPHFRGMGEMRCSYCDEMKNPTDVVLKSILNIHEHPNDPNKLVVVCDSFTCSDKHIKRFQVNR